MAFFILGGDLYLLENEILTEYVYIYFCLIDCIKNYRSKLAINVKEDSKSVFKSQLF